MASLTASCRCLGANHHYKKSNFSLISFLFYLEVVPGRDKSFKFLPHLLLMVVYWTVSDSITRAHRPLWTQRLAVTTSSSLATQYYGEELPLPAYKLEEVPHFTNWFSKVSLETHGESWGGELEDSEADIVEVLVFNALNLISVTLAPKNLSTFHILPFHLRPHQFSLVDMVVALNCIISVSILNMHG
jgi:hypothetical protein